MNEYWQITITTNAYTFTYQSNKELPVAIAITMKEAFREFFHIPATELRINDVRYTQLHREEYERLKAEYGKKES